MSLKNDDSQRTDCSQVISSDNGGIHQTNSLANQDTFILVNRILSWVVRILESSSMKTLESRISLLVCGGWLPGLGDARTVAALTNRPESSISSVVGDKPRPKYHVGRQPFYKLQDFAVYGTTDNESAETAPNDAPVMRKRSKKS